MTKNLLKNLTAAFVIVFTVGVGSAWAQEEIEFIKNPNNLPICPKLNYSKKVDFGDGGGGDRGGRTEEWNNCWGIYKDGISNRIKGDILEGEWVKSRLNGFGIYLFANGDRYIGNFRNNQYFGHGKLLLNNGNKYVGEFVNGKSNGQGTYSFAKGDKYVGEFVNGKFNGQGTYSFAKGDKYVGEFKDDKINGKGAYYSLSDDEFKGDIYVGEMKNGARHGKGVYKKANGRQYEGIWENGYFTQEVAVALSPINKNKNISSESKDIENERQLLVAERKKLENEKNSREQLNKKQHIFLQINNTQPDVNGTFNIYIKTNADTASLKINEEELGGRADGIYSIKKIARAGQETNFTIVAVDINGNTDSKTISVTRQLTASSQIKYAELNPALVKTQPNKDAVAIIIGIADYKNLPRADFANDDARAFYDYAIRGLGVRAENIKLLVDADAGQEEIYKAFKTWLPARVRATTDVYVYYSGHGITTNDGQSLYLLPQRTDRDLIEETAIAQNKINAAIQAAKPKSVTIFLDSCYSGAGRTGQTLLASARPIAIKSTAQAFPADFTVISASTAEQISSSSNELKHGIFSYYLMRGMEGDADTNKDGKITAGEMHSYLMDKVTRQASLANRVQSPQLAGDANRVLVGR